MNRSVTRLAVLVACTLAAWSCAAADATGAHPVVEFDTSLGRFAVEVLDDAAPTSAANFLAYVESGFYAGTVFHRVIPGFMIQGGGYTADLARKDTRAPIANEADNGLENLRGTLAMARTQDPDSATSQFFVNVADNTFLDRRNNTAAGAGYAVFGKVIEGMDVVDKIKAVKTASKGGHGNVPVEDVIIKSIRRADAK